MTTTINQLQQFASCMPVAKQFTINCLHILLHFSVVEYFNIGFLKCCHISVMHRIRKVYRKMHQFYVGQSLENQRKKGKTCLVFKSLVAESLGQQVVSQNEEYGLARSLISGLFLNSACFTAPRGIKHLCSSTSQLWRGGTLNY